MRIIRDIFVHTFLMLACTACSHVHGGGEANTSMLKAPSGCVLDEPGKLRFLHQVLDEAVDTISLYTHPCSGGLYLADPNKASDKLTVLHEGWWFEGLFRPQWRKADEGRALELTGEYITGVGPTGVQPFIGRIGVAQMDSGWRVLEPEVDVPPPAHPKELRYKGRTLFVVRDEVELKYLDLSNEHWGVDFSTERLVLMNADVHSSSDAVVKTDGKSYFLQRHRVPDAFPIGITFTRPGVLWMVVPKDDLSIRRIPYDKTQPQCDQCRAGAMVTMRRLVGYVPARERARNAFGHPPFNRGKPDRFRKAL